VERSGRHAAPGKHSGPARLEIDAPAAPRTGRPVFLLALGITAAVVAWGYLVYLAIDFGTSARSGETKAWWLLGLATIGAIACLFVGMLLLMRFVERMRASSAPSAAPVPPRPPGGRRIAR
jgi:RsiW-degrading membrane proteinase PrsW (M82 family)